MAKFTGHTITSDSALGAAKIQRSLRFNRNDSAHLTYTPASASSDRTKITISAWVKKCENNEGEYSIFHGGTSSTNRAQLRFYTSSGYDNISFFARTSGTFILQLDTTRKFRDVVGWYHIVARCDTTNGTANIYVNGEELTDFTTSTKPSGSQSMEFFNNTEQQIGERGYDGSGTYMNGYMAEINVIQGQALDASYFGFTDPQTSIWIPKKYEGTYGDGFYLDFSDNSSTSTLGIDKSPNGNDFTANNFQVSAGTGNDSLEDTPSNNFCTLNSNDEKNTSIQNGNLTVTQASDPARIRGTISMRPDTGKWYYEMSVGSGASYIFGMKSTSSKIDDNTEGYGYYGHNGNKIVNNSSSSYGASYSAGDTVAILYDSDKHTVNFYKNNVDQGEITGVSATTEYLPWVYLDNYGTAPNVHFNFGQRPFAYTPPIGAKKLNSTSLIPNIAPSIIRPKKHFETLLYTGTGGSHNVTGLEFEPDLVWAKNKQDAGYHHDLYDSVRGNNLRIFTSQTQAQATGYLQFGVKGGFSLTAGGGININTKSHVAWCWKAGGNSNTFNVDGVGYATAAAAGLDGGTANPTGASVNTEAGFSIVQFEAQSSGDITLSHGLGKKPEFWMWKSVDNNIAWYNYHKDIGYNGWLNNSSTAAATTGNDAAWKAEPTSTVFTHGSGLVNQNTIIMYIWTSIPGYSKIGSYTGNGSTTGSYVHCGFRPRWIMTKRVSGGTGNWYIWDTAREFNVNNSPLQANDAGSEPANYDNSIDILSDGFKLRASNAGTNGNGDTYMFMAYAEQSGVTPFNTFPNAH